MADSLIRLRISSEEYDQKLKRASDELQRYADECRKCGGTLQYVDDGVIEFTKALGRMDTVATTARGKVAELTKTYTEWAVRYNQMSEEEKKGDYGKALAASLDQIKGRLQAAKGELDEVNKSLNGSSGLSGALDQVAGKFGLSIKQLTGWGAALGAGKMALDVAKDAFFASEATVDEWGRTMAASESIYQGFLNAINTGDISGYLNRIDDIVKAARIAYDELDRLGTMQRIQSPQKSAQQTENERMRMMIQTGRYIAPVDGRSNAVFNGRVMQNGDKLTAGQIRAIEKQLQGGLQKTTKLIENEVKQTTRAISALYDREAKEIGLSKKEFMAGTSSMAEFDKRIAGYQQYQQWRSQHTTIDQQSGREIVSRGNPYQEYAKWGNFRVDGDRYNQLVQLVLQREQQMQQAYSMQGQTYRTINRAEGFNVRQLLGNNGGTGGIGGSTPVPVEIKNFDPSAAAAAGEHGVDTMPSVWAMMGDKGLRQMLGISAPAFDLGRDISEKDYKKLPGYDKNKDRDEKKLTEQISKLTSGISSITGGIKAMGFDLPKEVEQVIGVVQGVMAVIEGVNSVISIFGSTSMALNTIALDANTAALWAVAGTNLIPGLARGGIVPKAADGYLIPGNNMSGDNVFAGNAWVNSGELVLSKAQQGNLASQLSGNGLQNLHLEASVHGEQIVLAINNTMKRKNKGELATFR